MFEDLEAILRSEAPLDMTLEGETTTRDVYVATIAVLLDAADASSDVAREEINQVINSIGRECGLSGEETGELLEVAEFLRRESASREKFYGLINSAFNLNQRQRILAMAWRVFIADRTLDPREAQAAAALRGKLGLSLEAAMGARIIAEQQDLRSLAASVQEDESESED